MRFISLFLLLMLIPYSFSYADLCDAFDRVSREPHLYDDEIWSDLAKLDPENVSDSQIEEILRKRYKESMPESENSNISISADRTEPLAITAAISSNQISMTSRAQTALVNLRSAKPVLREKVEEFLGYASQGGMASIRAGNDLRDWRLHPARQYGANAMTIRLSRGFRIAFEELENGNIRILDLGKHVTH